MSQTTAQGRGVAALAPSRELLEAVLRNLHEGVIVVAPTGERLYANEQAARLTGYRSAAELLAAPVDEAVARFELLDEAGAPLDPAVLPGRRALAGADPGDALLVRFRSLADRVERVSEVRAVVIRDAAGAPAFVISLFRDVTGEQERAEAQRAAVEEYETLYRDTVQTTALLDALYRAAPVGLGFWDRELRYVRVNEALATINELPAEDHVGRTLADVVPQLAHVLEPIARGVLEKGEPVVALEMTGGTPGNPDAVRHWLASYYPVIAADGSTIGVGAVLEEITERRKAEQRTGVQHAVTRILASSETVQEAVPLVLRAVCERLGWEAGAFWSTEEDAPSVTWGAVDARLEGFLATTARVTMSAAMLPGRVAQSGTTEWLTELEPDRFPRAPVAIAEGLRSGVAFPVIVGGTVAGVLEAFSTRLIERDPDLEQTMLAVGAQLGQFLQRTRAEDERRQLYQRERQARAEAEAAAATLRKLERVSQAALEHLSLRDLLNALLRRIVEVLEADAAAILLIGADGHLHVRATVGFEREIEKAVPVPVGQGMAGRVAASRAPLLVPDLSQIETVSPVLKERGINSLVAIPLIVEDRVIGVVHAGSEALAQFVDEDARLLELIADRIALAINQASLYEAERAAQDRLHFLGEASTLLASSLDVDATLNRVARLAVPHFADWCAVDLVQPDGRLERVAIAHVDPGQVDLGRGLANAFPARIDDEGGVGATVRSGSPMLAAEVNEAALRAAYGDQPAYLHALLRLRLSSIIVVPLVLRERTLGALTFAWAESGKHYDEADLQFAQELAARAAVAVDNATLYRAAERRRDRLAFLAEASALLGSTLDVEGSLEELCALIVSRFADRAAIHLAPAQGPPRQAAVAHRDPAFAESPAGAPDDDPPAEVARVLASGVAEVVPPEPGTEERPGWGLVVPLLARSRTLGTLSLARAATTDPYDFDELEFAEDIARRAAVAIDNAQLYLAAEERAQAARVLASVGDGVFLIDRAGIVRTWNTAAATATGLPEADVVGRRALEAIPGWAAIAGRVSIVTAGAAPPRPESLPLDVGTRELWLSIHGVAVPDGVVYAFRDLTEERALETLRTDFVSTVSHELRTPLAAIYGAAMTLRRSDVVLDEQQREVLLDVVSGEADRLARTVNDILWASRLDTDSLHVMIQNCDPLTLIEDVLQAQRAHLDGAHQLVLSADEGLPPIASDPDKVGRVLINLVDNAVKYSPDGGEVQVTVRLVGSHVRFSVADQGLGIPPGEQRRIFEKFYRLDPNMNRGVGGTGLGLYICRELVRRMDGRIWVESGGLGRGSTFVVELPVAG